MSMSISCSSFRASMAVAMIVCASCGRPGATQGKSASPEPMSAAFEVAFGKPAPYATIDDSGDHIVYRPRALIALQPG
jgi:hypothetical protein